MIRPVRVEQINNPLVDPSIVRAPARAPEWAIPAVKTAMAVTDALIAAISFAAAFYIREGAPVIQQTSGGKFGWSQRFAPYGALILFVILIRVLALRYHDLYRLRGEFSFVDDGFSVFKATAIGSLLVVAAAFLYRGGFDYRTFSYARAVFLLDFLIALALSCVFRLLVRSAQTLFRRRCINFI